MRVGPQVEPLIAVYQYQFTEAAGIIPAASAVLAGYEI